VAGAAAAGHRVLAAGRGAGDGRRRSARVAAVARNVVPGVRPLVVEVGVDVLLRGKSVHGVELRAVAGAKRADLGASLVFVIEALVSGFRIEIDGARAGGARRRGLIREIERAAGEVASHGGVAAHCEISGESEREGADVAREI